MKYVLAAMAFAAMAAATSASPSVLIRHGQFYTEVSSDRPVSGDILIENGKIKAVGKIASVPAGARVIDVGGKTVTPGFLAISKALNANSSLSDMDDPASALVSQARRLGVTQIVSFPADCKAVFCGAARIVHAGAGFDTEITDNAGVWMRMEAGGRPTHPDLWNHVTNALEDAANAMAGRAAAYRPGQQPESKAVLDSLIPVLNGEAPLLVMAEHADTMTRMARYAEAKKLKLVILDGGEAWKIAAFLKAMHIPVVVWIDPKGDDLTPQRRQNVTKVRMAGGSLAFGYDLEPSARKITPAAVISAMQSDGMKPGKAVAAFASAAAKTFGQTSFGVIAPGEDADLVVWNAFPSVDATPALIFVNGEDVTSGERVRR